jgi:hypothetical protein
VTATSRGSTNARPLRELEALSLDTIELAENWNPN